MKKIIFSLLLSSMVVFTGCGSDDEGGGNSNPGGGTPSGATTITVTPESAQIDYNKQTVEFSVTSVGDWSIKSDADWATVSPSGGLKNKATTVKATVSANSGQENRVATLTIKSGSTTKNITITQTPDEKASASPSKLSMGGQAQTSTVSITANVDWTLSVDQSWVTPATTSGKAGVTSVDFAIAENTDDSDREATITIASANKTLCEIKVNQLSDAIVAPEGYHLVWNDEFNTGDKPSKSDWWYEVANPGWVNNELQRYVADGANGTAVIENGILKITAKKLSNGEIVSARVNTNQGWTYGYFEARLKLPKGLGTWPAFWMMPTSGGGNWPACGEIDIMEHVGADLNQVSSSIHCQAYYHAINTQKTAAKYLAGATDEFHTYALEWTDEWIRSYVDGVQLFYYNPDSYSLGRNSDTWPFNKPFQLKLNLAWGGDWGGYKGVDEKAIEAGQVYEIDYVRVFQK